MDYFEYKTISVKTDNPIINNCYVFDPSKEFNILGKQGWELVSVFPLTPHAGIVDSVLATFKRRLPSN